MTQVVTRGNRDGYGRTGITTLPQVFGELESFFNDSWMEEIFRDIDRRFKTTALTNFPPCNISTDKEGTIKFEFALAGYDERDLGVNVEDDKLVISASCNKEDKDNQEEAYLHHGIRAREFRAVYPIGTRFDTTQAQAAFRNGILTVRIPVAEEKKPRSLQIELQR
jgi:HSP20 family molecular chaperone IbpA